MLVTKSGGFECGFYIRLTEDEQKKLDDLSKAWGELNIDTMRHIIGYVIGSKVAHINKKAFTNG